MPTAASWTELRRSVDDVGALLAFRASAVRRPAAFRLSALVFVVLTGAAATLPALLPGAGSGSGYALDALLLLPTAMLGLIVLAVASAVASGGGRELLAREHAVAYPVSPTTDHLGALLLAPLGIAWLLQTWVLLGAAAYGVPRAQLAPAQIGLLVWVAVATAVGQLVAWSVEAVRRTRHGVAVVRTTGAVVALAAVALQVSGRLTTLLDELGATRWLVVSYVDGFGLRWAGAIAVELVLLVAAVALGAVPAHLAARPRPATSCASRVVGTPHGGCRAPCSAPWCAPTAARSGAPCRCAAASPCWRSGRDWSRWPATSTGPG